jgi:glycerol-3-phosphate dehydrogenase
MVASPVPGLVMVAGGKYTTYRLMARDAVDAVAHGLDWRVPESCTDRVPLAGADGYVALWNARQRIAGSAGLHVARIEHLLRRFGSLTSEVLALIVADPDLARPVTGADDYLRAEIVYAATHEGARYLEDVLARRTRIAIETPDAGLAAAAEAAQLMAGPLRWNAADVAAELERYRAAVAAGWAAQEQRASPPADAPGRVGAGPAGA